MTFVIDPPAQASVAVVGTDARFPARRVYCVGRNYAAHAREMGHDPDREDPFFFQKPADALAASGQTLDYPPATSDLHHEIELVVALKEGGTNITEGDARQMIYGYAVGLDMTRRDLQGEAKKKGRPWDTGKGFDNAAPIAPITPFEETGYMDQGRIWLKVNGEMRQEGDMNQMIWKVDETIAYLSRLFTMMPGDLVFTGTPEGVAAVGAGDRLEGGVDGLTDISIEYK
jgi:fumarylpyruvate hydrolase